MAKRGRKRKRDKSEEIRNLRTLNYRQIPELLVKTEKDAVDFIDVMGICLLFPSDKIELPNLLQSAYGMPHPMINDTHWDKETIWTWSLKDKLPETGKAFYGKFIQEKGTFLSPDFITYFYSVLKLNKNVDNFRSLYQTGELSSVSRDIAEMILENGPMSASNLRSKLKMKTRKGGVAFQQSITNLQTNLIITNYGTEKKEGRLPSTKYELVPRVFYDAVERAEQISAEEARKMVILRYINTVVQSNQREASRLFGWNLKIVESVFKDLTKSGLISVIEIDNETQYFFTKYESLAS